MLLLWLLLRGRIGAAAEPAPRGSNPWTRLSRRDRSLLLAFVVAIVLRVVWVVAVTRGPTHASGDAAEYLRMAEGFADFRLPTFLSGEPTAYFAPGYSMLLAPLVWVAEETGWISPAFVAALVNAAASVVTVVLTAFLAARWIGPDARNPAAWIMALGPGHIYFASTAHTESVFTCLVLVVLSLVTVVADRHRDEPLPWRPVVAIGLLVGFTILVRTPGASLLVVPALVLRSRTGAWRPALRPTAWLLAGALVILVPWTIRNGAQVGVWSPTSTQNATVVCRGHHDDSIGGFEFDDPSQEILEDCYRYSPYDDPRLDLAPSTWDYAHPDEGRWYREAMSRSARWALSHPLQEVRLAGLKLHEIWGGEWDAFPGARNYEDGDRWAGAASPWFEAAAYAWLYLVEALAVGGLVFVRACRRALPIWGLAAVLTIMIIGGVGQPHYRHPVIPFLAALAGGAVAALQGRRGQRATATGSSSSKSASSA